MPCYNAVDCLHYLTRAQERLGGTSELFSASYYQVSVMLLQPFCGSMPVGISRVTEIVASVPDWHILCNVPFR